MPIIRAPKPVVLINRAMLEDDRLSWAAKGVMAYIEAQPEGWTIDAGHLVDAASDSFAPTSQANALVIVNEYLDELIAVGYLERA